MKRLCKSLDDALAIVSILILILVFSVLIPFRAKQDVAELRKCRPTLTMVIPIPLPNAEFCFQCAENRAIAKTLIDGNFALKERIDSLEFPTVDVVLTSLGTYYITGYTSLECGGSVMTASGATVHKDDSSMTNPTTCAIDPALHDFGDLFYLENFGYYIAEDTGSAVRGKHLDLYFHDGEYDYALSITGYYEVFSVEYVYGTTTAGECDVRKIMAQEMLSIIEGENVYDY